MAGISTDALHHQGRRCRLAIAAVCFARSLILIGTAVTAQWQSSGISLTSSQSRRNWRTHCRSTLRLQVPGDTNGERTEEKRRGKGEGGGAKQRGSHQISISPRLKAISTRTVGWCLFENTNAGKSQAPKGTNGGVYALHREILATNKIHHVNVASWNGSRTNTYTVIRT